MIVQVMITKNKFIMSYMNTKTYKINVAPVVSRQNRVCDLNKKPRTCCAQVNNIRETVCSIFKGIN